uniref:Uncharacterized protein n=1 Tax=Ditylenchus dipsaci TaxID=166011 RepID=A0A915ENG6_9BILA
MLRSGCVWAARKKKKDKPKRTIKGKKEKEVLAGRSFRHVLSLSSLCVYVYIALPLHPSNFIPLLSN